MPVFDAELSRRIGESANIAVLVIDDAGQAPALARSLLEGGVKVMELTLRTPAAVEALRVITREVPEMLVGAGTVLSPDQVAEVAGAGAAFAVAPGLNPRVVTAAVRAGLSFAPGVVTPSEIEQAVELGCDVLKFFPAEPMGGLQTIRAIGAPYAHLGLRFIPLGGLNPGNTGAYLADPMIAACGGSWIAPRDSIRRGDWDGIRDLARKATAIARDARSC